MTNLVPHQNIMTEAAKVLPQDELVLVQSYLDKGGHQLSPDTAAKFYELFLNGSDCKEIHRLNKPFPYEAILIARVKYNWDFQRDEYAFKLQSGIKDKVMRAQLETTELMTDLLVAAKKKHGDKLKRYLQTGDEEDLKGSFNIDSLHNLLKIVEGLGKITGADRNLKIKTENTQNLNVNVGAGSVPTQDLTPDDAAQILNILAEAKRRKNAGES